MRWFVVWACSVLIGLLVIVVDLLFCLYNGLLLVLVVDCFYVSFCFVYFTISLLLYYGFGVLCCLIVYLMGWVHSSFVLLWF